MVKFKRRRLLLLGLVLAVFFLTSCTTTASIKDSTPNAKTVELKLAHFFPGTHPAETQLISDWSKRVEEATDGRVKVTSYPGETLIKAPDIYDGVVEGVADVGMSCFSYKRGRFPVLEAFELPGIVYENSKAASKVAWEGIKELNPKEVQDTKLLMVIATGPGDLFTKEPVKNLEDLQGLEVRATGISAKTLELLGAIPVAMPQSDAYESLSKGVVQGNLSPVEVLKGWRHAEVTNFLTRTPFLYNTLFFVTMNLDKWNSLPQDIQSAIEDASESCFEEVGAGLWDSQNEPALKWAVDENGMEIIELDKEQKDKWIDIVESMQDEFVDKMDKEGIDGEKVINTVKTLADKHNAQQ